MKKHFLAVNDVYVHDSYWSRVQELARTVVLPYQWALLCDQVEGAQKSHCVENFRIAAGEHTGNFEGAVFQDSDLYKWLEAVGYSLSWHADEKLEALADQAVDLIARTQQPGGYLNTYFTIAEPKRRWQNLMEGHELYCAGHFIEAACAYYQATGKRKVLDVAEKLCACIADVIGPKGKRGYPGHPEIELALVRLYETTGSQEALDLCRYFLVTRGEGTNLFEGEVQRKGHRYIFPEMSSFGADYFQSDRPVYQQTVAEGHAVRAMYLYSAMADLARLTNDEPLRSACERLYEDVTRRQMYVTGGVGSATLGERFTCDFDLPNDTAYMETCAAIGLMRLSQRMYLLDGDPARYDIWQRTLENNVMAGMGTDGKHYFYVNPLEVRPEAVRINPGLSHVRTQRPRWYAVACCPPNIARTICGLGGTLFTWDGEALEIVAHIGADAKTDELRLSLKRKNDTFVLELEGKPCELRLRIPQGYEMTAEGFDKRGGFYIRRYEGGKARYEYTLKPITRFVWADPRVSQDTNRVTLMSGQRVYCLEEEDNGAFLSALRADPKSRVEPQTMDWLPEGMNAFTSQGLRLLPGDGLYTDHPAGSKRATLTWIPYCAWGNRGEGEMLCWAAQALG